MGSYVLYLIELVVGFHSLGVSHTDEDIIIIILLIVQLGLNTKL